MFLLRVDRISTPPPFPPSGPLHALAFVRRELGMGGQVEAMQQLASLDPWHAQFYAVAASSDAGSFFGGAASSPPKESEPSKAATSR